MRQVLFRISAVLSLQTLHVGLYTQLLTSSCLVFFLYVYFINCSTYVLLAK